MHAELIDILLICLFLFLPMFAFIASIIQSRPGPVIPYRLILESANPASGIVQGICLLWQSVNGDLDFRIDNGSIVVLVMELPPDLVIIQMLELGWSYYSQVFLFTPDSTGDFR